LVKRFTPLKLFNFSFFKYFVIILLATILMSMVLLLGAKYNLNVFLKVLGGGLIYFAIIGVFLLIHKKAIQKYKI
ncbi:MAG: hypothetical protein ACP5O4_08355, partial [bacterium]